MASWKHVPVLQSSAHSLPPRCVFYAEMLWGRGKRCWAPLVVEAPCREPALFYGLTAGSKNLWPGQQWAAKPRGRKSARQQWTRGGESENRRRKRGLSGKALGVRVHMKQCVTGLDDTADATTEPGGLNLKRRRPIDAAEAGIEIREGRRERKRKAKSGSKRRVAGSHLMRHGTGTGLEAGSRHLAVAPVFCLRLAGGRDDAGASRSRLASRGRRSRVDWERAAESRERRLGVCGRGGRAHAGTRAARQLGQGEQFWRSVVVTGCSLLLLLLLSY